jgi:hypothetical protein
MKKVEKTYSVPLSKRFEVTFKKKFGKFNKGEKTSVTLPIAIKWINLGLIESSSEIDSAINESKAKELIKEKSGKTDDKKDDKPE